MTQTAKAWPHLTGIAVLDILLVAVIPFTRWIVGTSIHRQHGLRARSTWRSCDHRRLLRGSGRRDRLWPAGRFHVGRVHLWDLRGHCSAGRSGAPRRLRNGRWGYGVSFWRGLSLWLGRRHHLECGTPWGQRGRRRWTRGRLGRCLLRGPRGRPHHPRDLQREQHEVVGRRRRFWGSHGVMDDSN